MKLKLLLGIVFFALVSCSGDESSEPVNKNDEPVTETPGNNIPPSDTEKHLKSIKIYETGYPQAIEILNFQNDRLTEFFQYNSVIGGLKLTSKNYYVGDLVSHIDYYDFYNGNKISSVFITYDTQSRISRVIWNLNINEFITDNYNYADDIVIRTRESTENISDEYYDKTFYLNSNNQIYKMEKNRSLYGSDLPYEEVTYEGNNIILHQIFGAGSPITKAYSYDNETIVKGSFLKYNLNQFGSNANMILLGSFDNAINTADKFRNFESLHTTQLDISYIYEFDNDGYPVKRTQYYMNTPYRYEVIEYQ